MLNKLANIANSLDEAGMHEDANVVTSVLNRVANLFNRHDGPIEDFNTHNVENKPRFNPNFDDSLSGDNMEIMGIHTTLKNMGINPSGLDDDTARKIYQSIMAGQAGMSQFASNNKFKRLG